MNSFTDRHWKFFLPHVQSSILLSSFNVIKLYSIQRHSLLSSDTPCMFCLYFLQPKRDTPYILFQDIWMSNSQSPVRYNEDVRRSFSRNFFWSFSLKATTRRSGAVYTRQARSPAGDEVTDRCILPTARRMELVGASSRACICVHARALARALCRVNIVRYTRVLLRVFADSPRSRIPASWRRQRRLRRG